MRKTAKITIDLEGSRDKGNTYFLTEMSAEDAEFWLVSFTMAAARSGVAPNIIMQLKELGLAFVASVGLQALGSMSLEEVRPLLEKMFSCVQFISSNGTVRNLAPGDIEEVSTRLRLRKEVIELHTGFFAHADRLKSEQQEKAAAESALQTASTTPDGSQP